MIHQSEGCLVHPRLHGSPHTGSSHRTKQQFVVVAFASSLPQQTLQKWNRASYIESLTSLKLRLTTDLSKINRGTSISCMWSKFNNFIALKPSPTDFYNHFRFLICLWRLPRSNCLDSSCKDAEGSQQALRQDLDGEEVRRIFRVAL